MMFMLLVTLFREFLSNKNVNLSKLLLTNPSEVCTFVQKYVANRLSIINTSINTLKIFKDN